MAKRRRSWVALVFVLVFVALYLLFKEQESQRKEYQGGQVAPSNELFHGIPPEGTGGDPSLNKQKNRSTIPTNIHLYTIDEVVSLPHNALDEAGSRDRANWLEAAIAQAEQSETLAVQVEGYLIRAKRSGPESCNGYNDSLRDYHLWLGKSPQSPTNESLIAEVTPRFTERNPLWQIETFSKLARNKAKVRVTGWIMWDEEHPAEVGKLRASQWEIHPITKLDVWTNGKWSPLQQPVFP